MQATSGAIIDHQGRIMFRCAACHEPFTADDLFDLGLRLPGDGETYDDYVAAELLDTICHLDCSARRTAG